MTDLRRRVLTEAARQALVRAACVFLGAWTLGFSEAWLLLATTMSAELATRLYLLRHSPSLLERRVSLRGNSEEREQQRLLHSSAAIGFGGMLVLCGLDQRFGWSDLPGAVSIAGLVLVLAGMFVVFLTFRANRFASALVRVELDQEVISTGPYAWVRHPMYTGLALQMIGTPLALSCWWGLAPAAMLVAVFVVRLGDEELVLRTQLNGYSEYTRRVRHRLVPLIW